jgi:hypothetical protein
VATLVLVACSSELDTGVVFVGSTGDSETTVADPATSTDATAATDTTASAVSSGETPPTSETDGSTASPGSTTDPTATTAGETEGMVGSPCGSEQEVCALVELDGRPAGACGETLDLKGIVQDMGDGVWEIEDCGACELCGGPKYTVDFVAPAGWAPIDLPLCSRLAVSYAPMDTTPWACSFLGIAIWADDGLGEQSAPRYVARSIETSAPPGVDGLLVNLDNVQPEACVESGCCYMEPGKYEITFAGAGIAEPLTLAEHEDAFDVEAWSRSYDVHVERSHARKECWSIPQFDWVFLRNGA